MTLPTLSSGTTGNYNGVVIADDPADFASGQLSALYSYESTFGVRQVDGDAFPTPATGQTFVNSGALDGTTGTLTAAGLTAFPELKGPIPFDAGTFGAWSTVTSGAPYTPLITEDFPATGTTPAGTYVLAGIYQHPATDPQAGVSELALNFDYNSSQLQWLLLAPGLINWVTQDAHLGLYRNYFGMDIDDLFIADNEWSSALQCTPAATDPPDYTCPPADQGIPEGTGAAPADVQMSAADVDYVANWEAQTGIKLELAFNAIGACSYPAAGDESTANCGGSVTDPSGTYTDPGQVEDSGYPDDGAFVDELLKDQADFNWITHTWSHQFLGCNVWAPQVLTSATANASGGSLTAGTYSYEITAATAYGESEPSTPAQSVAVGDDGSVTLTWPEATNGTSTDGSTPGPTLAQLESAFGGGSGFWGYNIYREDPGSTTFGLVGQVAENPSATSSTTYSFTDNGTTPGAAPGSGPTFPSATNPGIDCASGAGSWMPATSTSDDASIGQEIGMDQAFAAANGLTNYNPAAVVTGEHSGLENPNMTAGLEGVDVNVFAQDGSRQPTQYSLGTAQGAPRYPSNIYYNAANWPDELNEYNTLYVAQGVSIGNGEVGHCDDTSSTTCLSAPATEAQVLASESQIMLGHVLSNNPMINYAHQSDLIGPATNPDGDGSDYGYTILDLISNAQDQYNTWYNASSTPFDAGHRHHRSPGHGRAGRLGYGRGGRQGHRQRDQRHGHGDQQRRRGPGPGHGAGRHHGQRVGVRHGLRRPAVGLGGPRHRGHRDPDRERARGVHQRGVGHRDRRRAVQLHGGRHRRADPVARRDRDAARGHHVHRQRQRHRHPLRHRHLRHRRQLPAGPHGQQQRGRGDPELHAGRR